MDKRRRAAELVKDALIVLLSCSALWLLARSQLLEPLDQLWEEETPQAGPGQTQSVNQLEAARPLGITAVLAGEGETVRYSAQYDAAACDALFQQTAGLLAEAVSSAEEPEPVSRRLWERALTASTGVCFDFRGEVPLSVLSRWLSGEGEPRLTAPVRRLLLADWQGTAALYYRDEEDGGYYRCRTEVVDPARLEEALAGLTGNGAFYAFESEAYDALDPDTPLSREIPPLAVYTASNPGAGGRTALEELAGELGFNINVNGVYYAGEWVARSGNDTLRLSGRGTVSYLAGEDGGEHFLLPGSGELFDAVETCRKLAAAALGSRCGQARLYLMSAKETGESREIRFGYSLNGIPVQLEESCAASFLVEGGRVVQFSMQLRGYTESEETAAVMPARQAAAALLAEGLEGKELLLVYADGGGDTVRAGWAAAGAGEERGARRWRGQS